MVQLSWTIAVWLELADFVFDRGAFCEQLEPIITDMNITRHLKMFSFLNI
jgi:hypothetical protein|tara:strand:- start:555 stop:704 length:150 start_codon:yes stop_codon:yes gene_type:complete